MQAFRILAHALRQVFGNLRQALGLLAMPVAIQAVLLASAVLLGANIRGTQPGIGPISLMLALMLGAAACVVWFAVRWHRFVLLDEQEKLFAPPSRAAFWRYAAAVLRTVVIIVPAVLAALAVLFVVSQSGSRVLTVVFMVVLNLLFFDLTLILGTALAGAAIGAPNPIRTAWERLKLAGGTLLVLSLMTLIGNEVLEALMEASANSGWPNFVKVIAVACYSWLYLLFSLSVLTTLWGHYVEGRPLR